MKLKYDWWFFKQKISIKNCNQIIKLSSSIEKNKGITGTMGVSRDTKKAPLSKKEKQVLKKERDSSVCFISHPLIYDIIMPFVNEANKESGWNFEIDCTEESQFTEYKKNNFYSWHQDCWDQPYISGGLSKGKIRKLSSILLLENKTKYEGGDLQFYFSGIPEQQPNIITMKDFCNKGDFIVFPSHIYHRVLPITKGKRFSLVSWHLVHPLK